MKRIKRKFWLVGLLCVALLLVSSFALLMPKDVKSAYAASETDDFYFIQIDDTSCSVGLANYEMQYAAIPDKFEGLDVTEILPFGFAFSSALEGVYIPESIKTVGYGAFMGCDNLEFVNLLSVTNLEGYAFSFCSSLRGAILPENLNNVGEAAFMLASPQLYIALSEEEVNVWDDYWLLDYGGNIVSDVHYSHTGVVFNPVYESDNTTLKGYSLQSFGRSTNPYNDSTANFELDYHTDDRYSNDPYPVLSIEGSAFQFCTLKSLAVGANSSHEIKIRNSAFATSPTVAGIEAIYLSNNVRFINNDTTGAKSSSVFASSKVKVVYLPSNLNEILPQMFTSCLNLQELRFNNSSNVNILPTHVKTISSAAFTGCKLPYLFIHSDIESVAAGAFANWSASQTIKIDLFATDLTVANGWNSGWKSGCNATIKYAGATVTLKVNRPNANATTDIILEVQYNTTIGAALNSPSIPTFTSPTHVFTGIWCSDSACLNEVDSNYIITADTTLYALWGNEVKLEFEGGKDGTEEVIAITGRKMPENNLKAPVRDGYDFGGYFELPNGGGKQYYSINMLSVNPWDKSQGTSLYAKWIAHKYSVVYEKNKPADATAEVSGNMSTSPHEYGTPSKLSKNLFDLKGWEFTGWNTEADGTGNSYSDQQYISDLSMEDLAMVPLYAQWKPMDYSLTYNANGGAGSAANTTGAKYDYHVTLAANAGTMWMEGYYVSGWGTEEGSFVLGTGTIDYGKFYAFGESVKNPNGAPSLNNGTVTLYAVWKPMNYSVVYSANGGTGTVSNTAGAIYDNNVILAADAGTLIRTGYYVKGWGTQAGSFTPGTGTTDYGTFYAFGESVKNPNGAPNANNGTIPLYAVWAPMEYYINYNLNQGTSGTVTKIEALYDNNVILASHSESMYRMGYYVAGWGTQEGSFKVGTGTIDYGTFYNFGADVTNPVGAPSFRYDNLKLYAVWRPMEYYIQYWDNHFSGVGRSIATQGVFIYDNNATLYAISAADEPLFQAGYYLAGWSTQRGDFVRGVGSTNYGTFYNFGSTIMNPVGAPNDRFEILPLYGVWLPMEYYIRYDLNEGTSGERSNTGVYYYDNYATIAADINTMYRKGYYIAGWATQAGSFVVGTGTINYGTFYDFGVTAMNPAGTPYSRYEILPLYAVWLPMEYNIRYDLNGGTSGERSNTGVYYYDNYAILAADEGSMYRMGYYVAGWSTYAGTFEVGKGTTNRADYYNFEQIVVMNPCGAPNDRFEILPLYAVWLPMEYYIQYWDNHFSGIALGITTQGVFLYDNYVKLYTISVADEPLFQWGYYLAGWSTLRGDFVRGVGSTNYGTFYDFGDIVMNPVGAPNDRFKILPLYGVWLPMEYYIRYDLNEGTSGGRSNTGVYYYDNYATIAADINTMYRKGYYIAGWATQAGSFVVGTGTINYGTFYDFGVTAMNPAGTPYSRYEVLPLYAVWRPMEYYIHYYLNQGTTGSRSDTGVYYYDNGAILATDEGSMYRLGYYVYGWGTAAGNFVKGVGTQNYGGFYHFGDNALNPCGAPSARYQTLYLYAVWTPIHYFIYFDGNKPLSSITLYGSMTPNQEFIYDNSYYLNLNNFSLISYWFSHWSWGGNYANGQIVSNLTATHNAVLTFKAIWTEKELSDCYSPYSGYYEVCTTTQLYSIRKYSTNAWSFKLMTSLSYSGWTAIDTLNGTLDLNNYTITYTSTVAYAANFGFILTNNGTIRNGTFIPKITGNSGSGTASLIAVGGVVAFNYGTVSNITVDSYIGRSNSYYNNSTQNVDIYLLCFYYSVGGVVGHNYKTVYNCKNYASIGTISVGMGGIVGINMENATIDTCSNYGSIYFDMAIDGPVQHGGIVSTVRDGGIVKYCNNYGSLTVARKTTSNQTSVINMANIAGSACTSATFTSNLANGKVSIASYVVNIGSAQGAGVKTNYEHIATTFAPPSSGGDTGGGGCVATGTLITLSDGTQVPVESLKGDELLLVWNLLTGTFDVAPIIFIDSEAEGLWEVITLYFSDGTSVEVIFEHAFFDLDLNRYVFMKNDAAQYIGHWFNKQTINDNGEMEWVKVQLVDVVVETEYTRPWSPVTFGYLCYYVNGMLSMPGATEGLINIFEVNGTIMQYDMEAYLADIELYGLFTYEEFAELLPIPEEIFEAFGGQYLKVSIGKGLIDFDSLYQLIETYAAFFGLE